MTNLQRKQSSNYIQYNTEDLSELLDVLPQTTDKEEKELPCQVGASSVGELPDE